jgi:hypothetical protein
VAEAANPTLLAETGGFLLGSAHRCGVAFERVERAGNAIHHFIGREPGVKAPYATGCKTRRDR